MRLVINHKLLFILLLAMLATNLNAKNPTISPKMKLYLASGFEEVWNEIVELLPLNPKQSFACHVTTAGFNADWTQRGTEIMSQTGFNVERIDIAQYSPDTIAEPFKDCDLIYVNGGDEFYLLQEFRRSGFDELVLEKVAEGIPYIGSSAGSMVLGSSIEFAKSVRDKNSSPHLKSYDGLNLIPLSILVHFQNADYKDAYLKMLDFVHQDSTNVVTLHDNQFVYVEGDKWQIIESDWQY